MRWVSGITGEDYAHTKNEPIKEESKSGAWRLAKASPATKVVLFFAGTLIIILAFTFWMFNALFGPIFKTMSAFFPESYGNTFLVGMGFITILETLVAIVMLTAVFKLIKIILEAARGIMSRTRRFATKAAKDITFTVSGNTLVVESKNLSISSAGYVEIRTETDLIDKGKDVQVVRYVQTHAPDDPHRVEIPLEGFWSSYAARFPAIETEGHFVGFVPALGRLYLKLNGKLHVEKGVDKADAEQVGKGVEIRYVAMKSRKAKFEVLKGNLQVLEEKLEGIPFVQKVFRPGKSRESVAVVYPAMGGISAKMDWPDATAVLYKATGDRFGAFGPVTVRLSLDIPGAPDVYDECDAEFVAEE
ncbi:MAG: hypothetical protein PWP76_143 [Candidatus Diapherotrites archaeon]|nr:hypothetical protein [Candidatus Diapherotrites archaeon]